MSMKEAIYRLIITRPHATCVEIARDIDGAAGDTAIFLGSDSLICDWGLSAEACKALSELCSEGRVWRVPTSKANFSQYWLTYPITSPWHSYGRSFRKRRWQPVYYSPRPQDVIRHFPVGLTRQARLEERAELDRQARAAAAEHDAKSSNAERRI
jgi:hypothetical protein